MTRARLLREGAAADLVVLAIACGIATWAALGGLA